MVDYFKFRGAWAVYRQLTNSPSNQNTRRRFYKFLGINEDFPATKTLTELPEEAARRIEWLLGPNAEVMYKIWKAQHEHEETGR